MCIVNIAALNTPPCPPDLFTWTQTEPRLSVKVQQTGLKNFLRQKKKASLGTTHTQTNTCPWQNKAAQRRKHSTVERRATATLDTPQRTQLGIEEVWYVSL